MESISNGFPDFSYRDFVSRIAANLRLAIAWLFSLTGRIMCSTCALLLCKVIIGIVSGYDIFLTIKYVESLPWMEMNPIGRWLMDLNGDLSLGGREASVQQTAAFISSKVAGNFITFAVIDGMAQWRRPMAAAIATVVASFQLCLLFHLLFALE